jgi:hypothetical protein
MAVRLDTSTKSVYRTTNLPSSTNFTLAGWFTQRGTQSGSGTVLGGVVASSGSAYNYIGYSGANIVIVTAAGSTTVGTAPSSGTPFFFAVTNSGTGAGSLIGYFKTRGATSFTTASRAGTSFTVNYFTFSDDTFGLYANGDFAPLYVFDTVLTSNQLLSLSGQIRPSITTSLNSWFPMTRTTLANNLIDYSGNGRTLSSTGTPSVADNPPLSWGKSSSFVTFVQAAVAKSRPIFRPMTRVIVKRI